MEPVVHERPYDPASIEEPFRSIFNQLETNFPDCEIWQRHENFGRWLSVGLVAKATGQVVTFPIIGANSRRSWLLHASELALIRERLIAQESEV